MAVPITRTGRIRPNTAFRRTARVAVDLMERRFLTGLRSIVLLWVVTCVVADVPAWAEVPVSSPESRAAAAARPRSNGSPHQHMPVGAVRRDARPPITWPTRFDRWGCREFSTVGMNRPSRERRPARRSGSNVAACLRGSDPALRDRWIIVSAHFDHLGVREGRLYPGADDNASGVAMMLEVARSLAHSPTPPRRSVMFMGFDLEEAGLFGSRYFVEHCPPVAPRSDRSVRHRRYDRPLAGRRLRPYVFVMGTEHAPTTPPLDRGGGPDRAGGRRHDRIGPADPESERLWTVPSRKVPYLFFSTGENPCYHAPTDTAETLDYPKLTAISRIILGVVRASANAPREGSPPGNRFARQPDQRGRDPPRHHESAAGSPSRAQDRTRADFS